MKRRNRIKLLAFVIGGAFSGFAGVLYAMLFGIVPLEAIGFVFSGIRHELGNPVNSIKMTLSALATNLDAYSKPQIRMLLERSQAALARVEYLLKALKSFNMCESLEIREVDAEEFLRGFLAVIEGDLLARGIRPELVLHPEVHRSWTDPRAVQQGCST